MRRFVAGAAMVAVLLGAGCGTPDPVTPDAPEPVVPGAPPASAAVPTAPASDDAALGDVITASTVDVTSASWYVGAPAGDGRSLADHVAEVLCATDVRWVSGGVELADDRPDTRTERVWGLVFGDIPRGVSQTMNAKLQERAAPDRADFGGGGQEAEVVHAELLVPAPVQRSSEETASAQVREAVVALVGEGSSVTHLVAEGEATRITYTGEAIDAVGLRRLAQTLADLTGADVGTVVARPADTSPGC